MNINLLNCTFICLLTLYTSLNAQQTFKPNDKEPGWQYNTIAELHDLAKKHLASLDTQIADKKAASESQINPFKSKAKKRYGELVSERIVFLNQAWTCPYMYWVKCDHCGGKGKFLLMPCHVCGEKNGHGFYRHKDHLSVDATHSCSPNTIRGLLKVTD